MRLTLFFIFLIITVVLVVVLDKPFGSVPPVGKFLSPQHGFWQNAEPGDKSYSETLRVPSMSGTATVYLDDRLVPHVFAREEKDAWFVQGWLHARFRLWQMEFQTYAAAGRLTEILGPGPDSAYLNNDRNMRRLGMVYGAKRSLAEMEKDSLTAPQIEAYTAGVNSYITRMKPADLPLEYRLLNYSPEPWTTLKTALFLKYMSYDLTGSESDIEYTNARSFFSEEDFNKLYPVYDDSASPIVPKDRKFISALRLPVAPPGADSAYFAFRQKPLDIVAGKTDKDNGSNNWAVDGSKTKSGRPILCNDPHLGLNLPSLWYEMQISTPQFNAYGVSFPGAPAIIIGFNDDIAWGVTNASRDVKDYYTIAFRDDSQQEYMYNGNWKKAERVIEKYQMKDGSVFTDTVAYTIFGPVIYDRHYNGHGHTQNNATLAVRWRAHDPSNELKTFTLLDRAKNVGDYQRAVANFSCPGQNFVFAARNNTIAIEQQGLFPAKWMRQGDFVMPGNDSSYAWQFDISHAENPGDVNPARHFVSSANQWPADPASYPFYLGGSYDLYRGLQINRELDTMNNITVRDMQRLQNENFNPFAAEALPVLLSALRDRELAGVEHRYLDILKNWNRRNDSTEYGPSVFTAWFDYFEQLVWHDDLDRVGVHEKPESYTLLHAIEKDSSFSFIDNIKTPEKETLSDIVTESFHKAVLDLEKIDKEGRLGWAQYKDAGIRHLLRLEPLSRFHLQTGGGVNIINATKQYHGPSWKMIVELTDVPEAYGIYPGGQNGNPGSRYYDPFVNDWAAGKYYKLWVMKPGDERSDKIQHTINFSK